MNTDNIEHQFLELLNHHKGILYKIANVYTKDEIAREDLIQEMILQLWRAYPRYDSNYKVSTWFYRIALNVAISNLRKETNRKKMLSKIDNRQGTMVTAPNADENEDLSLLNSFITQLKEIERAIIILHLEERSHEDISEILGISKTNVSTKINRIKQKLKQKFKSKSNANGR